MSHYHETLLIDKMIGQSYDTVKFVAKHIEYIKHVSAHMAEVYRLAGSADALDAVSEIADTLDELAPELANVETVANNIVAVSALATNLIQVLEVHGSLPQLLDIQANLQTFLDEIATLGAIDGRVTTLEAANLDTRVTAVEGIVSDSDKGGIVVSGAGSVWTVPDGSMVRPKLGVGIQKNIGYSPTEFGAAGDGAADDTVHTDAAILGAGYGGDVFLEAGKTFLTMAYANPKGARVGGPGQLVTAVTGGLRQRNTYADNQRLHLGHEYLNRPYQYMNLGQGTALGTFHLRIFGDSQSTNSYGDYGPTDVVHRAFEARGIPNLIVDNFAVSGTTWGTPFNPADLSGVDLAIMGWGTNDPANGIDMDSRLAAIITNMDTVLTAARLVGNAGVLAIILKMPNSTSDSPNNRDERWYEKLRGIYVYMARKYQCALFDTYGQFLNSRDGAAGTYMDDPYGDGRAVHPASAMNNWVWGRMVDEFFPLGAVSMYAVNLLTNEGATTSALLASAAPSSFRRGVSIYRATTGNGWPVDGFVRVTKNVDSGVVQELWNYANGSTRVLTRTAYLTGDTWNQWSGVPVAITTSNGWVNTGPTYAPPTATRDLTGRVFVEGMISGGTTTAGTVVGVLPVGYRPSVIHQFTSLAQAALVGLAVHPNGNIVLQTTGNVTSTSLGGIHFAAA